MSSSPSIPNDPSAGAPPLDFIAAELRPAALEVQRMLAGIPPLSDDSIAMFRQFGEALVAPPRDDVPIESRAIDGPAGAPPVAIYVINAKPGRSRGGILHMHGGGFVMGAARHDLRRLQDMAADLDCAIVSVEYRLAPETRYQGSIEDNYAALTWLHARAADLGVDAARIAVMGESAGGGHAAMLAITARDRGELPIAFQCLAVPMLDDRTGTTRAMPHPIGAFMWTAEANLYGWQSLLGCEPGGSNAPAVAPARVADVAGLPPAWIGTGSVDLFVDEDIEYARRLIAAGIPTELVVEPGAYHGFDATDTEAARRFNASKTGALRRAFAL